MYIGIIILSIILIVYTSLVRKKTYHGKEELAKWLAFKRFLNDFGQFDNSKVSEVILREKYLVYAVVLNCAKNLIKTMDLQFEDFRLSNKVLINTSKDIHIDIRSKVINSSVDNVKEYISSIKNKIKN